MPKHATLEAVDKAAIGAVLGMVGGYLLRVLTAPRAAAPLPAPASPAPGSLCQASVPIEVFEGPQPADKLQGFRVRNCCEAPAMFRVCKDIAGELEHRDVCANHLISYTGEPFCWKLVRLPQ